MDAAKKGDALEAERLTRVVMHKSIALWKKANENININIKR
jgi:hypothetical protein